MARAYTIAWIAACTLTTLPAMATDTATAPDAPMACVASIDGVDTVLTIAAPAQAGTDTDAAAPTDAAAASRDLPDCAPDAVLRHLTPELAEGERAAFCLVRQDTANGTPTIAGFSEGPRDDALTCTSTNRFCERVNASRDAALDIAGLTEDATAAETAGAAADGIRSLRERAGATILTGTGGAVASTLGSLGTSALAAVTAPVAIAAGVVSVVAVGGAVYVCR